MRAGMGGVGIASVLVIVGILLVLAVVVGIIVLIVVLCTRNKNKSMPQATVNAFVVGRRESASGYFIAFNIEAIAAGGILVITKKKRLFSQI